LGGAMPGHPLGRVDGILGAAACFENLGKLGAPGAGADGKFVGDVTQCIEGGRWREFAEFTGEDLGGGESEHARLMGDLGSGGGGEGKVGDEASGGCGDQEIGGFDVVMQEAAGVDGGQAGGSFFNQAADDAGGDGDV